MRQQQPLLLWAAIAGLSLAWKILPTLAVRVDSDETDGVNSRKLLGSSVVTSVSVIMDHPNGTKTYITDGEPESGERPSVVGSPGALLAPDRYEFYSFGKDGELVKKLMTLDQIQSDSTSIIRHFLQLFVRQGLIAGGDELSGQDVDSQPTAFDQQPLVEAGEPEGVNKVLESVQNVLKSELHTAQVPSHVDVPPVDANSWSILLPGFTNGEADFKEHWTPKPESSTKATTTKAPVITSQTTPTRTTVHATKTTIARQPTVSPQSKPPLSTLATSTTLRPPSTYTTVKYSAHYTTTLPNFKNKTTTGVKKPVGSLSKPQQVTKTTSRPIQRPIRPATTPNYKNNSTASPTSKPSISLGTTEKTKPSGIPMITHYLPVQSSIGPSEVVKTSKPAVLTKVTNTTTLRPQTKPTRPYIKPVTVLTTVASPLYNATKKPMPLLTTIQKRPLPVQPILSSVEGFSSNTINVSVSTPVGPPSTLKIIPALQPTTPRSTVATRLPITYRPPVTTPSSNKTTIRVSVKPSTTPLPNKPVEIKPKPVFPVLLSSVATHKPVYVITTRPPTTLPHSNASFTLQKTTPTSTVSLPTSLSQSLPLTKVNTTQSVPNTTSATTNFDLPSTTVSNELEQAPYKLAVSLKQPEQNVFEKIPLFSTTYKDTFTTMVTTLADEVGPMKLEKVANESQVLENKMSDSSTTTEPGITVTTSPTVFTAESTIATIFVTNDSAMPTKAALIPSTDKQPLDVETASTIVDQTTRAYSLWTTTTIAPEIRQTTSSFTEVPLTTTDAPSTTFKDQVMEEGISAVANILLNEKVMVTNNNFVDPQTSDLTLSTIPVRLGGEINDISSLREELDEKVGLSTMPGFTTRQPSTLPTITTMFTTIAETTSTPIVLASTPGAIKANKNESSPNEIKTNPAKREEVVSPKWKPMKESKLNPDDEEDQLNGAEETTMLMEKIKLTEKVPSHPNAVPAPPLPSKLPTQDPKIPSPAFKKPSYVTESTPPPVIDLHPAPYESMGAEASTAFLAEDVRRFADLCNELAFRLWTALTSKGQISSRSLVLSPFATVSLLAMVFLGARGSTSGQMNEILRLDDMVTFNPHQVLQNVTDSVVNSRNHGIATAAFVRELYSEKTKGKILDFYKERAQQYYAGHVEEVRFSSIGDVVRRRTNLLVKRQTLGKVPEYLRGSSLNLRAPLAAFSANIFQTDCDSGSMEGRDGEMYFVVRPSTRQRRLVPVPAVVWRSGFSAGYEPSLDATSVCLGQDSIVSTLLVLPGQQGQVAPGDGLARLEQRLIETSYRRGGWSRLLRSLLPRPGLELQVPRFSHRSVLNVTAALNRMGLKDLFSSKADLRGLNGGVTDLHLSDMVQVNTFSTCGEEIPGARQHVETYPSSPQRMSRENLPLPAYLDGEGPMFYEPRRPRYHFNGDDIVDGRPRTGRLPLAAPSTDPAPPRLRFDRPFLYIVRHNPSGIILHIGRFNPRLLP